MNRLTALQAFINGSVDTPMPKQAVQNPEWTRLAATCSTIEINKEQNSIIQKLRNQMIPSLDLEEALLSSLGP